MKILLTEGSSTSARQTLYALGQHGHTIDLVDPQRLCLGRFSRFVRRWYRCPPFTSDPVGYLDFLTERLRREPYDVLFPTHDQIYLLAHFRQRFESLVGVAVPDVAAIDQLQSKIAFRHLLARLELPQPESEVLASPAELVHVDRFPCWVKLDFSTAGCGVWPVQNRAELQRLADELQSLAGEKPLEILVQQPAVGEFFAVQAVYQHGRLLGRHSYRGRAKGVGGSAHARESVFHPFLDRDLERLGEHLHWHGALAFEYFYDEPSGRVMFLEANPRIGETMNATLSGTNLCQLLVEISAGANVTPRGPSRTGVLTHSLMMSLMGLAERGGNRRALVRELVSAFMRRGVYRHSQDDLIRPRADWLSTFPVLYVIGQLLVWPGIARRIIRRAVENYSLDAKAVRRFRELASSFNP